ncbi:MAG TPA: cytochrome c oxidase subunit II [Longimicrobium sp.]|nr:cytochrome c oxidase subunit II [Longimicrobium sp.]
MTRRRALRLAAFAAPAPLAAACGGETSALDPAGPQALHLLNLGIFLWITAGIDFVLVRAAIALALVHARRRAGPDTSEAGEGRARRIVTAATGATLAILLVFLVVSYLTGRAYAVTPEGGRPLQVTVVGHQWWWEVQYSDSVSSRSLSTANEIHVPVGRTVILKMTSHDVIHSFWVPNLAGKKDLVPGYSTTTWLRADRPGVYRGQCAEFCGYQHALMGLLVVAEPPAQFARWYDAQLADAMPPTDTVASTGKNVFLGAHGCVLCHTVRGTSAGGRVGPDLTHLASRHTLAAATIPNNRGWLGGWVMDPQGIKPGAHMPPNDMRPDELQALLTYLQTLR